MNSNNIYYDNGSELRIDSVNCYNYNTVFPLRGITSISIVKGIWATDPFVTYSFIIIAIIGIYIFLKTFVFWYLFSLLLPAYDFLWRRTEYHLQIETGSGWENATYLATRKGKKRYYELFEMRDALVEAMSQLDRNSISNKSIEKDSE